MPIVRKIVVSLLALAYCQSALGQLVGPGGKTIDIFMVDAAPVLDGVLDDDAWVFATPVEDLHEVEPNEFGPPSERSQFFVVYTRDALYIAARFYDSNPDGINRMVLRQGDFSFGEDSVTVILDPFNNDRSGYAFDLTANSVRNQAIYANVIEENWSWRGIWHGEAKVDDEGWVAEIEIPFKTLSFDPNNETWGINFARYIGRKAEFIGWVSANRDQNPAVTGHVQGIVGAEQGIGLDVVPGFRTRHSTDYQLDSSDTDTVPTLDAFYKLTPSLTAALTVNTDFSGTDPDPRQINLTRFGLFFPEQRSFFLQDADIFEFGRIGGRDDDDGSTFSQVEDESGRPFFSRRIGLSDAGETIDINVGGKLTGRAGPLDIGVLAIQQDDFAGLDKSDLFVARLAMNVLDESSLGFIATHGDPNSDLDNTVIGADFRYLDTDFGDGGTFEATLWYQQSDTEGIDGDDAAYGVSLAMPNAEGWSYELGYKELQANYFPALGFVNRTDVSDLIAAAGYTAYPESGWIRSVYAGVDYQRIETLDGDLQTQVVTIRGLELTNEHRDSLLLHYTMNDEVIDFPFEIADGITIPVGNYAFDNYCISLIAADLRALSGDAYYCGGDFFDGTQNNAGGSVIWRPNAHFSFSGGYDYFNIELPGGEFTTRVMRARADIAFTNTWYWRNLVQYDTDSYSLGVNSILGWIPRAGREMVLVVNREFIDFTRDQSFETVSGDVSFKIGYTFRF